MAILEEQFSTAYLRFNDDTAAVLQPFLTSSAGPRRFIKKWGNGQSHPSAGSMALRLLLDFRSFPSATFWRLSPNRKFTCLCCTLTFLGENARRF